jgi:hypothetical protein
LPGSLDPWGDRLQAQVAVTFSLGTPAITLRKNVSQFEGSDEIDDSALFFGVNPGKTKCRFCRFLRAILGEKS